MRDVKRTKPIKIKSRLSPAEMEIHRQLINECCISSQEFLHIHLMNYEPDYDIERSALINELSRKIELSNRLTWLLKKYLEKVVFGKKDPGVNFWTSSIATKNLEVLKNELPKIQQTLDKLSKTFDAKKRKQKPKREEARVPDSDKLTECLYVRVTGDEKKILKERSEKCLLSLSTYVRLIATGKNPKARSSTILGIYMIDIVGDLGRMKGIMNYWLSEDKLMDSLPFNKMHMIISIRDKLIEMKKQAAYIMGAFAKQCY